MSHRLDAFPDQANRMARAISHAGPSQLDHAIQHRPGSPKTWGHSGSRAGLTRSVAQSQSDLAEKREKQEEVFLKLPFWAATRYGDQAKSRWQGGKNQNKSGPLPG